MSSNYYNNVANLVCLFWFNEFSLLESAFQYADSTSLVNTQLPPFSSSSIPGSVFSPSNPLITSPSSSSTSNDSSGSSPFLFSKHSVPSPSFIDFIINVIQHTQLPVSAVSLALLYILRLKRLSPRQIIGNPNSEYRVFTVALILANKFLDDNTYTNKTWADVTRLPLREISTMEVEFLANMRYSLVVSSAHWSIWLSRLPTWLAIPSFYRSSPTATSAKQTKQILHHIPSLTPASIPHKRSVSELIQNDPSYIDPPTKKVMLQSSSSPLPPLILPSKPPTIAINNDIQFSQPPLILPPPQNHHPQQAQNLLPSITSNPPLLPPPSSIKTPTMPPQLLQPSSASTTPSSSSTPTYGIISATRLSSSPYAPVFPIRTLIIPTTSFPSSLNPINNQSSSPYPYPAIPLYHHPTQSQPISQNGFSLTPSSNANSASSSPLRLSPLSSSKISQYNPLPLSANPQNPSKKHPPVQNVPMYYYSITDYKSRLNPTPHRGIYTQGIPNLPPILNPLNVISSSPLPSAIMNNHPSTSNLPSNLNPTSVLQSDPLIQNPLTQSSSPMIYQNPTNYTSSLSPNNFASPSHPSHHPKY